MKEIFSQVIEKEKSADSKIAEAKAKASALLMSAEAENREQIKRYRDTLQTRSTEEIENFASQMKNQEEQVRQQAQKRMEEELSQKSELVEQCAQSVFKILVGQQLR